MGYITPQDKMEGRAQAIFEARREKLARAQAHREQCYAATTRRCHDAKGVWDTCRAYARTRVATLMVACCLEWKSGQGGVRDGSSLRALEWKASCTMRRVATNLIFAG
jgi:hypothetical protein